MPGRSRNQVVKFRHPACEVAGADGIIIGGHAAARTTVDRMSQPARWRQPFGSVTVCLRDRLTYVREHHVTKTRCILQRRFPDRTGSRTRVHEPDDLM
jgi:hypothetical protein